MRLYFLLFFVFTIRRIHKMTFLFSRRR
uniref:Uncharacterized protein n=1 Tax=Heterorhabditis bacteriophora TaxID=37862 RepID=A0A1I7W6J4_HETBA